MKLALRLSISLAALALLAAFVPWPDLRDALANVSAPVWLGVLAGFAIGHLAGVLKWRALLAVGRARLTFAEAAECYAAGLFANLCLPSIVGGDAVRTLLAAQKSRRPEAAVLGSVVDRWIDLAVLGALVLLGALALPAEAGGRASELALALRFAAALGAGLALVALPILWLRLERLPARARRSLARARVALRRTARRPGTALAAVLAALGIQAGFVMLGALFGRSLGIDVPLSAWFLCWPLAKIAGLLPISIGGLGVREGALALLLAREPFLVPEASSAMSSLLWQSVLVAGGLLAGLLAWWLARRGSAGPELRGAFAAQRAARNKHAA